MKLVNGNDDRLIDRLSDIKAPYRIQTRELIEGISADHFSFFVK